MPKTVLNEENVAEILSEETEKLVLENHFWLTKELVSQIGAKAPNLKELCLRAMPFISNTQFRDIFDKLGSLERVDLSGSTGLHTTSLQLMLRRNKNITALQLSACSEAIDDTSARLISNLQSLVFLDISFCKKVTDQGLIHFNDKNLPMQTVVCNGVTGVSGNGLAALLNSCKDSLVDFEAALMDQESMKSNFFSELGVCWKLQYLDISGNVGVDDNAF